ncbi:hypothetical protein [Reinekea sp. G2M2-21]|uniref:hypothetical protein n=1 Tax=Reinekea sp. G2M2-21 TaxID=2788942 RepID=UPI0018A9DEC0|nr:hypothetical protein [Reinekea sp. G2M2-21]
MKHPIIELQDDFNPNKVWLVRKAGGRYSVTQRIKGLQQHDWVQMNLAHIASATNREVSDIQRDFNSINNKKAA